MTTRGPGRAAAPPACAPRWQYGGIGVRHNMLDMIVNAKQKKRLPLAVLESAKVTAYVN